MELSVHKKNLNKKAGNPQSEDKVLLGPIGPFLILSQLTNIKR